jgi:GntR family transcriptional regulator, transcriptional repressor for pyruvate dehydrogenase complex
MLLAQRIVGEIADQGLEEGTVLMTEREMIDRYGVARGTLREALRFLEMHDILAIKPGPGGGAVVKRPQPRVLASSLALMLQFSNAPFSVILETRQQLEPVLAQLAAMRATENDILQLEGSLRSMEDRLDDGRAFLLENRCFHDIIASASGNQVMALLLRSVSWIMDASILGVDYDRRRRAGILKAHTAITARISEHDEHGAADAMEAHMDEFARYLRRHYVRVLEEQVRWDLSAF